VCVYIYIKNPFSSQKGSIEQEESFAYPYILTGQATMYLFKTNRTTSAMDDSMSGRYNKTISVSGKVRKPLKHGQ